MDARGLYTCTVGLCFGRGSAKRLVVITKNARSASARERARALALAKAAAAATARPPQDEQRPSSFSGCRTRECGAQGRVRRMLGEE